MKKKDGIRYRYCVDYRLLNKKVLCEASWPLANIQDHLRQFDKPKVFSSLDLLSGYFQVPVAEQDKEYFAFSDGRRHLEFNRMPQGARNSGPTMSLLMELVFKGIPPKFLCVYLANMPLATPDVGTHLTLLKKVFAALKQAGLKVCWPKVKLEP